MRPHEQAALLEEILNISQQMAQTRELDPLLDYVMTQALKFTQAQHGYLVLLNEDNNTLDFRVTHGNPYEGREEGSPVSHSIIQKVIETGEPELVIDAQDSHQNLMSVVRLRLRSVLCMPLVARQELLGVLYIENRKVAAAFGDEDIPLVMIFANQAAIAIKNAQLNEQQNMILAHLEDIVAERTAALEQARQQAEAGWAAALEENSLRTRLLGNVSHDLRSPLSVVVNALELMIAEGLGPINEGQHEWLGRSLRAAEQVLRLSNDILDMIKMEKGKLELFPQAVDPYPLIEQSFAVAQGLKRQENVEVYLELDENLPMLWADPDRVQQILTNLFTNAFKFTHRGSVVLRVAYDPSSDYVQFAVADTGIGIPEQQVPTVFDRFQQAHDSVEQRRYGTGLGLAICKELVERHQGKIWVQSEVDVGTTFYFTLPIAN